MATAAARSPEGWPDIQFHLGLGSGIEAGVARLKNAGITVNSAFVRPRSRGTVRLASADIAAMPLIDPNYFAEPEDRRMALAGLRLAREILRQPALKPFILAERQPGPDRDTDEALLDYAYKSCKTDHHPIGTCAMGSDAAAVVGPDLQAARDRGPPGLRFRGPAGHPLLQHQRAGDHAGREGGRSYPRRPAAGPRRAPAGSGTMTKIILLNGVGSVGKSSIAKALQTITTETFLHVSMDAFMDMMPAASFEHPDGVTFETIQEDGKPSVVIRTGPVAERVFRGMRHAVAAMAAQGNNMILDEVLLEGEKREYPALLAPFELHLVGVFAPLEVLEARERERGDRMIGLARWQYERVHRDMTYELEIDTSSATPMECAELIKRRFGL